MFSPTQATLSCLSKPSEYGKIAIQDLCDALDDTFAVLEQLTDRAEAEVSNLQSLALPTNEKSLAYVQAILKHNFSPSKVADLANNLQSMQSEIQACFEKLESSFGHVNDLYTFANNRLVRVSTSTSIVSTSTMLSARIKLASWLKQREGTWGLLKRNRPNKLKLARPGVFSSDFDIQRQDFLSSDPVLGIPSDVFSKILHHLCSNGPLQLRYVLFVSKRLYHAAVGDASLWTTISFDVEFVSHFKWRPANQADRFIEQCLFRSASLPLSLSIQELVNGGPVLPYLSSFKNSEYKGFERCSSLVWSYHSALSYHGSANLLPAEFPSLQYMSLSGFDYQVDSFRFPKCPVLVKVEMLDHYIYSGHSAVWGTIFADVTSLSFGNSSTRLWRSSDIEILSLFVGSMISHYPLCPGQKCQGYIISSQYNFKLSKS